MKKLLLFLTSLLFVFSSNAQVLLDAKSAAGGLTTWNITTTHANELIIISVGGYGTGGNTLSTAAGTVKVNGNNATYETRGLWLDPNFSWQADIWAYVAPVAGIYTCTCTETGLNSPFYFNFAASCYENGCVLSLANIVIGGNNSNHGPTTITASITTPVNNCWVYGTIDNNDNGGTGTVAWSGQLTMLNKTYINNGVDGAQADTTYALAGVYNITSTDIGASNVWMTFALIAVNPTCVLPVDLLNFDCNAKNNGVELNWVTATEKNSSHFTIERSLDGIEFTPIQDIPAAGNSETQRSYTYIDKSPMFGANYYRLKETDLDGSSQAFNITSCSNDQVVNNDIYPNPSEGNFTVALSASDSYQSLVVTDMLGRQVFEQQFAPNTNPDAYSINLPANLKGIFLARIMENGQVKAVKKIVVY